MKISYLQLSKLLAASGFGERDFAEFARSICQLGPKQFTEDVMSMRQLLSDISHPTPYDIPSPTQSGPPSDIEEKIERLLIHETALPKLEAVALLTTELRQRFPEKPVPPESRKGFQLWIHKLTSIFPEKELLHLATSIRNRFVHERPSDWRLK